MNLTLCDVCGAHSAPILIQASAPGCSVDIEVCSWRCAVDAMVNKAARAEVELESLPETSSLPPGEVFAVDPSQLGRIVNTMLTKPPGEVWTSNDLLAVNPDIKRPSLHAYIYKLVKTGRIVRRAFGVYALPVPEPEKTT